MVRVRIGVPRAARRSCVIFRGETTMATGARWRFVCLLLVLFVCGVHVRASLLSVSKVLLAIALSSLSVSICQEYWH
jgi:hypothetical protein